MIDLLFFCRHLWKCSFKLKVMLLCNLAGQMWKSILRMYYAAYQSKGKNDNPFITLLATLQVFSKLLFVDNLYWYQVKVLDVQAVSYFCYMATTLPNCLPACMPAMLRCSSLYVLPKLSYTYSTQQVVALTKTLVYYVEFWEGLQCAEIRV